MSVNLNPLRLIGAFFVATLGMSAAQTVLVRTMDGKWIEGTTTLNRVGNWKLSQIRSLHNGAPASTAEAAAIQAGLAAIQGKDRAARDQAVEELTSIGLPVLTPLLDTIRDTDQHEPKSLYNLFNRIIPSIADQPDRNASLFRLEAGQPTRGAWPQGELKLDTQSIPWSSIRLFAVRKKSISREVDVHSLRHSTQIEYLDSGLHASPQSNLTATARGFTRLSWKQDEWATGPNGLTKPAPNYKTNLVDGHPFGALLARITAKGTLIFLGENASKPKVGTGRLQLAINDNAHWQNNFGSYLVSLVLTEAYDLGDAR